MNASENLVECAIANDNGEVGATAGALPASSANPNYTPDETQRKQLYSRDECEVRIQELEQKMKDQHVQSLHKQQTHQLAIAAKQNEIEALLKNKEEIWNDNASLRRRIRELEDTVEARNADLSIKESHKSDYDAVLRRLSTSEAAKKAFKDDRARLTWEMDENKKQSDVLALENDRLKRRIEDLNKSFIELEERKREHEQQIRTLDGEVAHWKHKYECESEHFRAHSAAYNPAREDPEMYRYNTGNSMPSSQANNGSSMSSLPANNGNSMLSLQASNGNSMQSSQANNGNSMLSLQASNGNSMQSSQANNGNAMPFIGFNSYPVPVENSPLEPKRKKRFFMEPSKVPRCKNCMALFGRINPENIECRFHRATPQPYPVWKHQVDESSLDGLNKKEHKFWPCCEKLSRREPLGCEKLRHHEIIHPGGED